ncbi:hypothetical protein [Vibrio jasicida]|uniref:hypothetical protein n=1 Tax=Vibrio jasicida TaxID=766224 RepID=UPI0007AFC0E9|nr:hypothetical protein [Vibrio jasicida]
MRKIILPLVMVGFFALPTALQANTENNACNDTTTAKTRALFLKHYKKKDYTAAYYAAYLYADSCPALFSAHSPSEETLWLLSDYSLAASRTDNQKACDDIASLIKADTLQQHPRITQAIQTNLGLCSLKQTESRIDTRLTRSSCALDKNFLAIPASWQGNVANYESIECIGPKTLTQGTSLTLLKVDTDNKAIRIPFDDVIPNDGKTRLLFLGNERPIMVANVFNTEGLLQPQTVNKRTEYYSLRAYQTNETTQQQVAQLNTGMVQSKSDNDYSPEYLTELEKTITTDFIVDPYNWWGHKALIDINEMANEENFLVAQYKGRIELVYNLGNDIKTLDLLTGNKKTVFTAPEPVYVNSIEESLLYIKNKQDDYFELELTAATPSLVHVPYAPPPHKGRYSSVPLVSADQQSQINSDDGQLFVESLYHRSILINDHYENWVINNLSWGGDSNEIYFDNSSAYACIWRVDLLNRKIERVIPIEAAVEPYGFRVGNVPYVVYVDRDKDKLYLATPM